VAEGISRGGQVTTQVRQVSESGFTWPQQVPWSELGPEFTEIYGHDEDGKIRAEHFEVTGQSGSGKSYAIATILQQRAARWGTAELCVLTKQTDDSIPLLGWPEVGSYEQLRREKYRQALFWPSTRAQGADREAFHEHAIYDLLTALWPDRGQVANVVIYLDEVRYVEGLSPRLKKLVRMYWREGRSHGISLLAGAQRPVEMVRDQHSESRWKAVFPPADEGDMQRFAEMLGRWKDWQSVLESLDQTQHQFVLRNSFTKDAYITWIDEELRPLPSQSGEGQKKNSAKPEHIYGPQDRGE
jgi:hypothetical protein